MKSAEFFDAQFQRQVRDRQYALNAFEILALDHLVGSVLDLGCGLGNLSLEAGRRGHRVVAVDASPTAVARIDADAQREGLAVRAVQAEIGTMTITERYDTIVAIGLLMFFRRETAHRLLREIQDRVVPGGRAIVNVLVEGTTFMDMFDPDDHYLFGRDELDRRFTDWIVLTSRSQSFPAPGGTLKVFSTMIAEKPGRTDGGRS